jgi:riboflavin synthase
LTIIESAKDERPLRLFTGLVETVGQIREIQFRPPGARISIDANHIAPGTEMGASISVNGCCLTVVAIDGDVLSFEAIEETLQRTNLGLKQVGDAVNLERSLKVGDRMGGHFVTGHIDGLAKVARIIPAEKWSTYYFGLAPGLTRQMASKGSIAIDGVSLTLIDVRDHEFSVGLIPHTLRVTTLGKLKVGDSVNIETDVLAKYVQRQLDPQVEVQS